MLKKISRDSFRKKINMFAEMKWSANFFLILFLVFTVTPTIISVVNTNSDNTELYSVIEEEIQKEVKISLQHGHPQGLFPIHNLSKKSSRITYLLWENIHLGIVSPPPDLI